MSQFTYALQERSDDGQIDEILGLSDDLDLLQDVLHASLRALLVDPELQSVRNQVKQVFAETRKTPGLRIQVQAADRMWTVSAAPYLSVGGR